MREMIIFIVILGLVGIAAVFIYLVYSAISLWFQARMSGADIGLLNIAFMRFRKVPPELIVTSTIMGVKAGLTLDINRLESHHLAEGDVNRVVKALIAADKAEIPLKFDRAAAIDLAGGRNVLEAVQMSVNPEVIRTDTVIAVARDGIQMKAMALVTVRANIDRLVGGAGKKTILARVGEGMATTMGSAKDHKAILENPDHVSNEVMAKALDKDTAYEILSIDISNVEVGENIGAKLGIEQADADKKIAEAGSEKRRSMAIAVEQEMKARVVEMKAKVVDAEAKLHEMREKVVEAEAAVPHAMAEALNKGRLGVMDYYQIKNIQAETEMRDAIALGVKDYVERYGKKAQTDGRGKTIGTEAQMNAIVALLKGHLKIYEKSRSNEFNLQNSIVSTAQEYMGKSASRCDAEKEMFNSMAAFVGEWAKGQTESEKKVGGAPAKAEGQGLKKGENRAEGKKK